MQSQQVQIQSGAYNGFIGLLYSTVDGVFIAVEESAGVFFDIPAASVAYVAI